MNLPSRIDLANQTELNYRWTLIGKLQAPEFHIWFDVLQNAANKAKSGERLHVQTFESACTAMARYLGLAPEIEKEEDDKPIGRMKCVKCELETNEKVCPDCGGTEFRQMEPGEMGWL